MLSQGLSSHLFYKGDLFLTSRFDPLEGAGVLVKTSNFFRFRTRSDELRETQEENLNKIQFESHQKGPELQNFRS